MALINTENDINYISLKEAIELLADKTNSNIWEVATYLLNKDVYIQLYSHSRDIDHKIIQTSFLAYQGGQTSWIGDNDASAWLEHIAKNETHSYSPRTISNFAKYYKGCIDTFWDREAFFNNTAIQEALELSEKIIPKNEPLEKEEQASYKEYYLDRWVKPQEPDYQFWDDLEQYRSEELESQEAPTAKQIELEKQIKDLKSEVIALKQATQFDEALIDNNLKHIDSLEAKNKVLLEQLTQLNEQLEIQTKELESKLGSTRAENNVSKLILALSEMAAIDINKPYAQYEAIKAQAELLGVDRFPSNENITSWLKRAKAQNPN